MKFDNILLEQPEPGIYLLTVNRPSVLNALNPETIGDIGVAIETVDDDHSARAVVLTGPGDKAFVAGADISRMRDMTALEAKAFSTRALATLRHMERLRVPVIAAVNGFALGGGCEFAMACDVRIASEKAKFGQPEVNLGVTPGFAGTQRLPRLVGMAKAKELLLTGDMIKADEAFRIGLVNKVMPPESLMDEAKTLAETILTKGPVSIKMIKTCVNRGLQTDIDTAAAFEADAFGLCFASGETKEGMTAFLEKREAKFR